MPDTLLVAKEVSGQEKRVGGPLGKPPHEVGIPVAPEGHIHAHVVAFIGQLALQVAPYAIQHLEFEAGAIDSVPGRKSL
jgi:hypothetical protein